MSEMLERADKWIADSGDDTEELQEAAAVVTALKEAYLKFFNLHHTLAVNEAGIKGILCDALKIEHYQHSLYDLSQMVTAKINDLEIQVTDRGNSYELADKQNSEMMDVLKDIYRITSMTSKASHKEQTEIFQRMRRIIGVGTDAKVQESR